jgi:hypothetical protein
MIAALSDVATDEGKESVGDVCRSECAGPIGFVVVFD